MPRATVDVSAVEEYYLETLEGGQITLRRMTYGQTLERLDLAQRMQIQGDQKTKTVQGEVTVMNSIVTAFEYKCCIVDHNLEDETGRKLNLANPADLARLDPRVGEEISDLIDKQNKYDAESANS